MSFPTRRHCESCGTPVDGLALCDPCTARLAALVADIIGETRVTSSPFDVERNLGIAAELDLATNRQTAHGGGTHGGGRDTGERERPLPIDLRAARARADLDHALRAALTYAGIQPWPSTPTAGLAEQLAAVVPALRWHRGILEHLERLTDAVAAAHEAVDRQEREYVGPCGVSLPATEGGVCEGQLRADPGATVTSCPTCGHEHSVARRRHVLAADAAEHHLPAADVSRALTALAHPVTEQNVRDWHRRGKLIPASWAQVEGKRPRPLYRVADVQTLAATRRIAAGTQ